MTTHIKENMRSYPKNPGLSTFFYVAIQYEGKEYSTVEHLYQALRCLNSSNLVDKEYAEVIKQAKTLYAARLLGDQYVINANMNWFEEIQEPIGDFQRRGLKVANDHSKYRYETMKFATSQKFRILVFWRN